MQENQGTEKIKCSRERIECQLASAMLVAGDRSYKWHPGAKVRRGLRSGFRVRNLELRPCAHALEPRQEQIIQRQADEIKFSILFILNDPVSAKIFWKF